MPSVGAPNIMDTGNGFYVTISADYYIGGEVRGSVPGVPGNATGIAALSILHHLLRPCAGL